MANHWPAHGSELRRLLHALFTWKTRQNGREVTLLSGGVGFRLETLVQHIDHGDIRQIVCAPVADHTEEFWSESFGQVDDDISIRHGPDKPENGVTLLEFAQAPGVGVKCANTHLNTQDIVTGRRPLEEDSAAGVSGGVSGGVGGGGGGEMVGTKVGASRGRT